MFPHPDDTLDRSDPLYRGLLLSATCAQFSFWSSVFAMSFGSIAIAYWMDWMSDRPPPLHRLEMVRFYCGATIIGWLLVSAGYTASIMWHPKKKPGSTWEEEICMNWNMARWGNPIGLVTWAFLAGLRTAMKIIGR